MKLLMFSKLSMVSFSLGLVDKGRNVLNIFLNLLNNHLSFFWDVFLCIKVVWNDQASKNEQYYARLMHLNNKITSLEMT